MKYKLEMSLLLIAITLFSLSAIFYSYSLGGVSLSSGLNSYPYSGYAIALVGFGSAFMLTASLSFSRRSKNLRDKSYQI